MRPGRAGINAGKKMLENARCNAEEGKKHEAYAKSCNGYYAGEGAQPTKMYDEWMGRYNFLEVVVASSGRFMEILQGKGSAAAGRGSTWELNILTVGTNWTKENGC
ncbi:hypothetical protein BGAL_0005g00120 [Botrytis galanthina]|uniref:Uncharacterized protein n=1 Tax=Botrytis galanthina TaxID=278940 RepID=A0A4S8RBU2_9HELO|nr:hypothetical protein BGAL_0005g00120 [Botrytis galanthina]